jgi:uroporphyrinogen decarboxylase
MGLTRRERVFMAINHEEADFVPYNFHAVPGVWQKVREHYGLSDNHEVIEFIGNHIIKVGSDFNYNPWAPEAGKISITPSGGPVYLEGDREGILHQDEFGCVWNRKGSTPYPVAHPLAKNLDLDDYEFPDPYREGRFKEAEQLAELYRGKVFLFGKLGMCLFERAWSIRGFERLLIDMRLRPGFVEKLLDRILRMEPSHHRSADCIGSGRLLFW